MFTQSTCALSVAAWPAGKTPQGGFIGRHRAGKKQLAGRRPPTLNKSSFLHRHTQPPHAWPWLHLCLSVLLTGNILSVAIYQVCMQAQSCMSLPCVEFLSACGCFSHRREKAWVPVDCSVCSEEKHALLKFNPEHSAALLRKHGGVLKEGFLLKMCKERAEQGTCMLQALRQNLWPQTQSVVSHR